MSKLISNKVSLTINPRNGIDGRSTTIIAIHAIDDSSYRRSSSTEFIMPSTYSRPDAIGILACFTTVFHRKRNCPGVVGVLMAKLYDPRLPWQLSTHRQWCCDSTQSSAKTFPTAERSKGKIWTLHADSVRTRPSEFQQRSRGCFKRDHILWREYSSTGWSSLSNTAAIVYMLLTKCSQDTEPAHGQESNAISCMLTLHFYLDDFAR